MKNGAAWFQWSVVTLLAAATLLLAAWPVVTAPRGALRVDATVNEYRTPPALESMFRPGLGYPWGDIVAGGYVVAEVRNVGTKQLDQVILAFPFALHWCWALQDRNVTCKTQPDSLMLGSLQGRAAFRVEIWTTGIDNPEQWLQLHAYHEGVYSTVAIHGVQIPGDDRWLWVRRILIVCFLLSLGALLALWWWRSGNRPLARYNEAMRRINESS